MQPAFFFYANPYQPLGLEAARALQKSLTDRGCRIYGDAWLAARGVGEAAEEIPRETHALVAFGGDGTLLRAAPRAHARGLPIFGVNTGSVGFLMDGNPQRPDETAELLLSRNYRMDDCPALEIRHGEKKYFALNDLSLTRGEHPGVIETTVLSDGERVLTAHGDGVVIATPLGSTAYALSSGGPVIRPDVQCLTVTAIAARELLLRPALLPLSAQITVLAHGSERRRLQLAVDGQTLVPVTEEAEIVISVAREPVHLIRPRDYHFFITLRKKQKLWNQDDEQE